MGRARAEIPLERNWEKDKDSTQTSMEKGREKGVGECRGGREKGTDLPQNTYTGLAEYDVNYAANDDEKVKDIPGVTKITLHRSEGKAGWGIKKDC